MPIINKLKFRTSTDLYIDGKPQSGMIVDFEGEPDAIAAIKKTNEEFGASYGARAHGTLEVPSETQFSMSFVKTPLLGGPKDNALAFVNQLKDIAFEVDGKPLPRFAIGQLAGDAVTSRLGTGAGTF